MSLVTRPKTTWEVRCEQAERELDELKAALAAEREAHERTKRQLAWKAEVVELPDKHPLRVRAEQAEDRIAELEQAHKAALHGQFEALQRIAALEAGVRECEWSATAFVIGDDGKTYIAAACPMCRRPQPDGHNADCKLAALLKGGGA